MRHHEYYDHKNNVIAKKFYEHRDELLRQNSQFLEHNVDIDPDEGIWRCSRCAMTWMIGDYPDAPYFLWQECKQPSQVLLGLKATGKINPSKAFKDGYKLFTRGKILHDAEVGQRISIHLADGYYQGKEGYDQIDFSADQTGIWIYNRTTKKYFVLSYPELMEIAKEAGVGAAASYSITQVSDPTK